jgi:hypothetical protein
MSVSGISSSNLFNYSNQNIQNNQQQFQQEFHQLGQDLQSGNVSAAQKDYTNLKQDFQNPSHTRAHHHHRSHSADGSELSQPFDQLGQALQSGNVSSGQTAYSSMVQDLPQLALATNWLLHRLQHQTQIVSQSPPSGCHRNSTGGGSARAMILPP